VGKVTSAVYSPRLKKNIALAMVDIEFAKINGELNVEIDGSLVNSIVVEKPFFDPKKQITTSN
jgi:aminomethyltransferase